jgi:homoserine dehydrogenase
MNVDLKVDDVEREGISNISADDIESAKAKGQRWKLIGQATLDRGSVTASVTPTLVELSDPLASVGAAMNALTFETDVLKSVTITGAGAGGPQTGFGVLSDLLELQRRLR